MNDTKTVSGAIVHVTDADEAPLVKCLVDITPKQSGTGTPSPSNVRAISGWESVSVYVSPTEDEADGHTTTTSLGRTVYGGTLDVVSGVLTVTHSFLTLDGSGSYGTSAGSASGSIILTRAFSPIAPTKTDNDLIGITSNYLPETTSYTSWRNATPSITTNNAGNNIWLRLPNVSTKDAGISYLTSNPLQICYPLATPQTYTLTGQEVSAMYGENYIWANAGDTTIEYTYLPYGLYGEIRLDGEFLPKPRDFMPAREDVYAGEYTTCTGKTIADKIGWKFSDLDLQWDALKQSDIDKLINLTNACSLRFDDADGLHTEDVIRTSAVSLRNRNTIDGVTWWRDVSAQFKFINTHNE